MDSSEHPIANACAEKFKRAQKGIREAQVAFEELDSTLEEAWKEEWLAEETQAQSVKGKKLAKLYEPRISGEKGKESIFSTRPCFADVLLKEKTFVEMQIALNEDMGGTNSHFGSVEWITRGIQIQALQYALCQTVQFVWMSYMFS